MRKLAIVGSGPLTRDNAPWDDSSFDIWVFNEAANSPWCKRWDAVFQMHPAELYQAHNTKDPKHWDWLQQEHGKPIYMQAVDPLVPDSVPFPLENAIALTGYRYLAATVADAVALGILQEYDEIHMWGVELSFTEYQYQAECIRFWAGFAKGRLGEKFQMHCAEHLFEAPLYGYEGSFSFGKEFFEERRDDLDKQWMEQEKQLKRLKDKLAEAIYEMKFDKVQTIAQEFNTLALQTGETSGALAEAERYVGFGDRYADRGGFEYAAAKSQRDGEAKKVEMLQTVGVAQYIWNVWRQVKTNEATQQLRHFLQLMGEQAYNAGALLGMYKENINYIQKYDAMYQAMGAPVNAG